jgi:hypothetical protein
VGIHIGNIDSIFIIAVLLPFAFCSLPQNLLRPFQLLRPASELLGFPRNHLGATADLIDQFLQARFDFLLFFLDTLQIPALFVGGTSTKLFAVDGQDLKVHKILFSAQYHNLREQIHDLLFVPAQKEA